MGICRLYELCFEHSLRRHSKSLTHYNDIADASPQGLRPLCSRLDTLDCVGKLLDSPFIVTNNASAIISAQGAHAPLQQSRSFWQQSATLTDIRISSDSASTIAYLPANTEQQDPGAVLIFDQTGQVQHRLILTNPLDSLSLQSLPKLKTKPTFLAPTRRSNVVYFEQIQALNASWDSGGRGWHMDWFLRDGGNIRRSILPTLGDMRARRVKPTVVGDVLTELFNQKISFCRTIPGESIMQSDAAPLIDLCRVGELTVMQSANATTALALPDVTECWEVCYCDGDPLKFSLELYNAASGRCIAILSQDEEVTPDLWNALLASLPSPEE